jgi:uncharacterized damage-inducible protein DinB
LQYERLNRAAELAQPIDVAPVRAHPGAEPADEFAAPLLETRRQQRQPPPRARRRGERGRRRYRGPNLSAISGYPGSHVDNRRSLMSATNMSSGMVIPTDALLRHWQGHRRLTRRVIEAFPEDQLFTFTIGGMRSFGTMALELLGIAAPMVRGVVTGDWNQLATPEAPSKSEILRRWDDATATIDASWPQIPPERFQEMMTAFGQYPGRVYDLLLYAIDNEIHHRGQAYVYLRALGVEPPPFYERE